MLLMSWVLLCGFHVLVLSMDSGSSFRCLFCPCVFSFQSDLDLHLKVFGAVPHLRLWRCVHVLLEVDGFDAGVDEHGEWHWRYNRFYSPNTVRACRDFMLRAERSDVSIGFE